MQLIIPRLIDGIHQPTSIEVAFDSTKKGGKHAQSPYPINLFPMQW
jgi:hypothetical protein